MDESILRAVVERGRETARDATMTRQGLRWRSSPTDAGRQKAIADAIEDINDAMADIRSARAWVVWHPVPEADEDALRAVSRDLQYERKQLKKMQR